MFEDALGVNMGVLHYLEGILKAPYGDAVGVNMGVLHYQQYLV